jgi:hypothetical protein
MLTPMCGFPCGGATRCGGIGNGKYNYVVEMIHMAHRKVKRFH